MPKYAGECNGRLIDVPFMTRNQAAEELDVILDRTPQAPAYELYALVPISDWDEMQGWIENLGLVVNDG